MRCAAGIGFALALATLASCRDSELRYDGSALELADGPDRWSLDVPSPLPLSGIVEEVSWLEQGLAGIIVELPLSDGEGGLGEGLRLTRWTLPLPAAQHVPAAHMLPALAGLPMERLASGTESLAEGQQGGFWVQGSELAILHRANRKLPETLRLRYPIHAAHLAGTALGAGFAAEDVHVVRVVRGLTSVRALALPSPSTLRWRLPPLPSGRIEGALSALTGDILGPGPEVVLRVDGEELYRGLLEPDGTRTALGPSAEPYPPLQSSVAPRTLELEILDAPGSVVFFEQPAWRRPRSWRDGPNVLLVVPASLRADRMGFYGSRVDLTPNLDVWARDMLVYEQAWSTSSQTLASMASLLTSTHASQHQAWLPDSRLGGGVTTLAEVLRDRGYRTAAFTGGGYLSPAFGLDRGFNLFDARGGGIEAVLERARAFLDEVEGGPWFLLVHSNQTHAPYEPPQEAKQSVVRRHPAVLRNARDQRKFFQDARSEPAPPAVSNALGALYDECVRHTDQVLGAFLDDLKARGVYEDAMICITSDHGTEFGERGGLGHGDTLYAEQLHVPLMFKFPGNERSQLSVEEPVSLLDVAPTLVQVAELEPDLAGTTFVGRSLISGRRPSRIFAQRNDAEVGLLELVREDGSVYIEGRYLRSGRQGPGRELYELYSDPAQKKNLASRQNRRAATQLKRGLDTLREAYGNVLSEETQAVLDPGQLLILDKLGIRIRSR